MFLFTYNIMIAARFLLASSMPFYSASMSKDETGMIFIGI